LTENIVGRKYEGEMIRAEDSFVGLGVRFRPREDLGVLFKKAAYVITEQRVFSA
jgi:hypothetical protein